MSPAIRQAYNFPAGHDPVLLAATGWLAHVTCEVQVQRQVNVNVLLRLIIPHVADALACSVCDKASVSLA